MNEMLHLLVGCGHSANKPVVIERTHRRPNPTRIPATLNLNEPPVSPVIAAMLAVVSLGGGPHWPSSPSNNRDHLSKPSPSPRLRPSLPPSHLSSFGGKPNLTPNLVRISHASQRVPNPMSWSPHQSLPMMRSLASIYLTAK